MTPPLQGKSQQGWTPLPRAFYDDSPEIVARKLNGHFLVSRTGGKLCSGVIVETEAYLQNDPACHAFNGLTKRNASMFGEPGHAYVYFIYGNHFCFNAVCRPTGIAEAVLIRAIHPTTGIEVMSARRTPAAGNNLTNGPGKLCAALAVNRQHDGTDLCSKDSEIFIARNQNLENFMHEFGPLVQTTRIGITKAADLPLRFYLQLSPFVSKKEKTNAVPSSRLMK